MQTGHFISFSKNDVLALTTLRRFETKLGEQIQVPEPGQSLGDAVQTLSAKYMIIGIPEDIGVLANHGVAGTSTCWNAFLQAFLNIQSNDFLTGENIAILGHFDFSDLRLLMEKNAAGTGELIDAYRHAVNTIDQEVESIVKVLVTGNKIPIVIGGGHNNAYPLIKGAAKGLHQAQKTPLAQINCINLDAHADYRPAEGRHSGNAFRYAEDDGFMQKYCAIGIHENYLQQNVWVDIVNNPFVDCITYEDIFIHEKRTFRQAVSHAIQFTNDMYTGIELDLDCIQNVLSSATSPSGVNIIHARQYMNLCAAHANACYVHICEGAASLETGLSSPHTGKLISYLVTDFIKMNMD